AGSPGKPNSANSTAGSSESIAMYKSVKDNKGFYIARFEAGIAGTTASTTTNDTNKQTQDGSVKPVSQKGVGVWNCISWGGTTAVEASDNLPGNDNANGAVKVARSMYKNDSVHKVTSTLCYGVQWDVALNFIDSNYISGNSTGYVKDSSEKGNYTKSIAVTGSNTAYQQKHIYDMAGNVFEWTMEAFGFGYRISRGGYYDTNGSNCPASHRIGTSPNDGSWASGFRPALYL
ncbi:MAG: formylglycine-generating enzyme family protein, partial [Clostridia bacterium]|nr:formylglycine-generating enzyme family protein [Clostridia bacterium]